MLVSRIERKECAMKYQPDHLIVGVCYYPEHWDRKLWSQDMQRIREWGIEVIRIAEFAWALMEPEDGVFDFPCLMILWPWRRRTG